MDERQISLSRYRLEKAENCIKSAHILTDAEEYYGAANRSYYAIFHCVRAILALDGVDFSKHSGVMAYFQRNYVKTGIFDKEYSKILREAFDVRSDADYDDYYIISKDKVQKQISQAEFFFDGIKQYIEKKLGEEESKNQGE
ncbi:MAG: HEPN domain-containing protein [Lachnospiraceae bacterium]|nr:HEPN domain-containing protein [Lachnospiraceae bacterium]